MKTVIITNYTFDADLKRITFTDFASVDLRRIISITNVSQGQQMYFHKSATFNGSVTNNVLTLNFNSDAYSDTDKLIIEYALENTPYEILPLFARVASGVSVDLTCYTKGAKFIFDITASAGTTPELTIKIQEKDVHGNYIDITGAVTAVTAVSGIKTLIIDPRVVDSANYKIGVNMPRTYRLSWTIAGGGGQTFTFRSSIQPID